MNHVQKHLTMNPESLGFTRQTDGTEDPRGISWVKRGIALALLVDAFNDVYVYKIGAELEDAVSFFDELNKAKP